MRVCVVNKDITEIINSRLISVNVSLKDLSYERGIKYYYEVDKIETLNGSHRQVHYDIYSFSTGEYLFMVDEKQFQKYFVDLEDYREDTINQILQ